MQTFEQQVDRGVELIKLCHQLKCEKMGLDNPYPIMRDKTTDINRFAQDVDAAISNMQALRKLYPMLEQLAEIGRKLQAADKIDVQPGDSYAEKSLEFLNSEFGDSQGENFV